MLECIEGGRETPRPGLNEEYWTFYISEAGFKQVLEATWKNDITDRRRWREGHIYSSRKAAEEMADKFRKKL